MPTSMMMVEAEKIGNLYARLHSELHNPLDSGMKNLWSMALPAAAVRESHIVAMQDRAT